MLNVVQRGQAIEPLRLSQRDDSQARSANTASQSPHANASQFADFWSRRERRALPDCGGGTAMSVHFCSARAAGRAGFPRAAIAQPQT